MHVVGQANIDNIDLWVGQRVLIADLSLGDVEFRLKFCHAVGIAAGNGQKL